MQGGPPAPLSPKPEHGPLGGHSSFRAPGGVGLLCGSGVGVRVGMGVGVRVGVGAVVEVAEGSASPVAGPAVATGRMFPKSGGG